MRRVMPAPEAPWRPHVGDLVRSGYRRGQVVALAGSRLALVEFQGEEGGTWFSWRASVDQWIERRSPTSARRGWAHLVPESLDQGVDTGAHVD